MLSHESLWDRIGPGTGRNAGSDVADGAPLQKSEPFHVCSRPTLIHVPRLGVPKPDHFSADVLMKIAAKVKGHLPAGGRLFPGRSCWRAVECPARFVDQRRHSASPRQWSGQVPGTVEPDSGCGSR